MSDEKKHMIDDKIAPIMSGNDTCANIIEYKEFITKLDELYKANVIKPYERFNIALVKDAQIGWGLLFTGTRQESKDETSKREAIEGAKKKQLGQEELKQYLKLHKKYGKHE